MRALDVLFVHPGELAEALLGAIATAIGLSLLHFEHVWGTPYGNTVGGASLVAFGIPQIAVAVWGSLRARHLTNLIGTVAYLFNAYRAVVSELAVEAVVVFYGTLGFLCLFLSLRTAVLEMTGIGDDAPEALP